MGDRLRSSYEPPRFVHGDCHANAFFLVEEAGLWRVTGTVDMEVASAGDVGRGPDEAVHRVGRRSYRRPADGGTRCLKATAPNLTSSY